MKQTRTKNICKMLFFVVAVISMLSWASQGFCQGNKASVITGNGVTVQTVPNNSVPVQSSQPRATPNYGTNDDCCQCNSCNGCEVGCPPMASRGNMSATACYNCRVNGSYKYPVPRQYTYFWPGIYSQKRMTDYVSPHQGLRLESPAKVFK